MATCPTCRGRKQVHRSKQCEVCEGTGKVNGKKCTPCQGTGYIVYLVNCPTCSGKGTV